MMNNCWIYKQMIYKLIGIDTHKEYINLIHISLKRVKNRLNMNSCDYFKTVMRPKLLHLYE